MASSFCALYNIKNVPNKGNGLVAITAISRGTCILSESPFLKVSFSSHDTTQHRDDILGAFGALSREEKKQFYLLRNSHQRYGEVAGRFRTNACPLGVDAKEVGIFLNGSRLNHSCVPNAHFNWNGNLQQGRIHALRDIAEAEEITIFYLNDHRNREARLEQLQTKFGFSCACTLCSLPSDLCETSDERCNEIERIYTSLIRREIIYTPLEALHATSKLLELLSDEGFTGKDIVDAYCCAFEIVLSHGDIARATIFASRAASIRGVLEGVDSPAVEEWLSLASDPSQYQAQRVTEKWQMTKDDIPRELKEAEFESWLWKKGTTEVSTQVKTI